LDWKLLSASIVLGIFSGLTPGPLLYLTMSQTLRFGLREGIKIALTPILADPPIILLTLMVLKRLVHVNYILGVIDLFGAALLVYVAYESLTFRPRAWAAQATKPHSLVKGLAANFFNPHPYLFWLAVGGPLLLKASRENALPAVGFLLVFYGLLVGSIFGAALLTDRFRQSLPPRAYFWLLRVLGILLLATAAWLLWDGLRAFLI